MPRYRRPAAATVAAVALMTLAACGGGTPKSAAPAAPAAPAATTPTTAAPTPLDLVLASSKKMADVHTMRFAMTMGMAAGSVTGTGAMDTSGPLMSMSLDMGALLPAAERQAGTTFDALLNDQAMYIKFPGLAAETGGKHWIRVDLATAEGGQVFGALVAQLRDADPTTNLKVLDGAQDVTVIGQEDVRGVPTTHYRFTIDVQKGLDQLPESVRSAVAGAFAQLGTTSMPGEVWLDGDGLPRRFVYDMTMPLGTAAPVSVHFSMEFFDFGQPVQVSLPHDGDIVDSSALSGK